MRALGAHTAKLVPSDALDLADVRAEPLVQLLVPALADEIRVELAERRRERVRIPQRVRAPVRVRDLELVAKRQVGPFQNSFEQPVACGEELDRRAFLRADDDPRRLGPVRADDDAAVPVVRTEVGVRVVQLQAHSGASRSRRTPATGIPTQSGRLLSS